MGAVDLGSGSGRRSKGGGAKKPKRVGFVLDMTPLVDVAFLLLTFFMFATTMAQPTMMEMKIPPDIDTEVPVDPEKMLTVYVAEEGDLFYTAGKDSTFRPLALKDLQAFAIKRNMEKGNDLILSLQLHPKARYADLVTVLDELNKSEAVLAKQYPVEKKMERKRKFSIQRLDSLTQHRLEQI